jgi:hypothetical protein
MKLILSLLLLLTSFSTFALENCREFFGEVVMQNVTIQSSDSTIFKGCPEYTLLNDTAVCPLKRIEEKDDGVDCIYEYNNMYFRCDL